MPYEVDAVSIAGYTFHVQHEGLPGRLTVYPPVADETCVAQVACGVDVAWFARLERIGWAMELSKVMSYEDEMSGPGWCYVPAKVGTRMRSRQRLLDGPWQVTEEVWGQNQSPAPMEQFPSYEMAVSRAVAWWLERRAQYQVMDATRRLRAEAAWPTP